MKKDKIKADNVEELMEIVRAVQRGEEPTQESIRRNAKSVPESDSSEPYSREDAQWEDEEEFRPPWDGAKDEEEIRPPRDGAEDEEKFRPLRDGAEEAEEDSGFHPVRWLRTKRKTVAGPEETEFAEHPGKESGAEESAERTEKENDAERKSIPAEDEWDEDDEFTRLLNEDGDSVSEGSKGSGLAADVLEKVSGLFASGAKRASGRFSEGAKSTSDRSGAKKEKNARNAEESEKPGKSSAKPQESDPQLPHRAGLLRRDSILYDPEDDDEDAAESELVLDPESRNVFERIAGKSGGPVHTPNLSKDGASETKNRAQSVKDSSPETEHGAQGTKDGSPETGRSAQETKDSSPEAGRSAQGTKDGSPETERNAQGTKGSSPETGSSARKIKGGSPETEHGAKGTKDGSPETEDSAREGKDSTSAQSDADKEASEDSSREGSEEGIIVAQPKRRRRKTAAEKEEELRKGLVPQRRTLSDYLTAGKDYVSDVLAELREKGISRREFAMLGAVAVFVILLIVAAVNAVSGSIEQKRKSENVTADDGLRVTVEAEPETWSARYPVQLKFSVSGAQIQQIRVNGEVCSPDEDGIVTVQARDYLLEAAVETDQGTKTARIEIPKLDGDAPVVHAAQKDGKIELTAVDGRSLVSGIYYAAYQESPWNEIPLYLKYTEPIVHVEGMTYRFFAEDAAGNRSVPVTTTMEEATGLTLARESLSLYPGESGEIGAQAEPSGALLNNLKYESLNPELFSVESGGRVTAIAEGTGTVRVSADGVAPVICTVQVADSRTVTVSAVGDCTLGTDESFNTMTNFNAFDSVNGHSYFFSKVKDILSADDVTFANLEGTFTTATTREQKEYAFKGDPSYAEILPLGSVEVVTLANNHSSDYGEQSLADTKNALAEAGVDYCIGDTIVLREVNGIQTAFIGIYVLADGMERESQVRQTIASAQAQGAQLIVVAFHWGSEKASEPDATQVSLAHTAIDCGADLVVGHHPHVLQGIECYNGRYIAYSLGNFCFGGNSAPSDTDTMILQQTFSVTRSGAEPAKLTVIPCSISSDAGYNNYQPAPAQGDLAASIIERINDLSAVYGVTVGQDGTVIGAASASQSDAPWTTETGGNGETDPV